jgi:hypothetical protein
MRYDDLVKAVQAIIEQVVRDPDAAVRVTQLPGERPEFVIISDAFDDLTQKERQDRLWEPIREQLGEDAQRIALILPRTWDEVR